MYPTRSTIRVPLAAALLALVLALFASVLAPTAAPAASPPSQQSQPAHPAQLAESDDVVLADFESSDALTGATLAAPELDDVHLDDRLASEGRQSMRFEIAAFESKAGRNFPRVWLNAGSTVPDLDWTPRTYLRLGVANASNQRIQMYVVVWDSDEQHSIHSVWAEPYEHHVFEIRTAELAETGVDLSRVDRIQLSTERSPEPQRMYVDDIRLTDQRADVPAERAAVAEDLIGLMELERGSKAVSRALHQVHDRIPDTPAAPDQALTEQADRFRAQLDDYRARIEQLDGSDDPAGSLAQAQEIHAGLDDLRWRISRLAGLVDARIAEPDAPIGLGFADSMSRVYPRDLPCPCTYQRRTTLDVVRGEHESVQLVALPYDRAVSDLTVRTSVRAGDRPIAPGGAPGSAPTGLEVTADPVGSLDMSPPVGQRPAAATPWRPSTYQGWTPDPILTSNNSVDVAEEDLQAFWITVSTAADIEPGEYQVELTLRARGLPTQRAQVAVTVHDVEIPAEPKLRTAIGHDPKAYAEPYGVTEPEAIAKLVEQEYDFLGDYLLQGDNIYRSVYQDDPPSVADLRRIDRKHGGLRQFAVWYFDPRLFDLRAPETWAADAEELFDRIEPYVEDYRAAGFVDEAYLYCCDETRAEHTELIKFVLTRFEQRFPDVEVLSTTIDDRMGQTTGLDELINWWVRDVPWYDPRIIDERHARGDEAWWYVHQANTDPTPNVFVNYDPIQLRVLLGPMTHQADIDGFLYYRVDRWYGKGVLDDGPLSSWDPRTWEDWAGDGSLFYPGADGPIPSIRLENIRDGLEDHNLLRTLEQAIESAPPDTDRELLRQARQLLGASDVVDDNYRYVREPEPYRSWRAEVIETIVALKR